MAVEDFHCITRAEAGQLWFTEDVGPLAVATEGSETAESGMVNQHRRCAT